MPTLTIETAAPARVLVRDGHGRSHHPEDAVRDRTAAERPGVVDMDRDPTDASGSVPGYTEHFLSTGTAEMSVPRGSYTVTVERGPEHRRVERRVDVDTATRVVADPERWVDLAAEGWWSGDLHVHRPLADAATILRAEDLHLAAFVTRWTGSATGQDEAPGPPRAALTVDGDRHATAPTTEDERGGGAWLLHGAAVPDLPGDDDWWDPPGRGLVDQARAHGAWFDCEKLTWWETPVMMATGAPDSVGVLNNHYVPGGFMANEAWGRPRDRATYPGAAGTSRYQLDLYYRYLNLGLRLPASAGSASGVLPAPPGYNRVYVQAPGPLTVPGFFAGLRAGRSVVTNGPLLSLTVGDAGPGDDLSAGPARVRAEARTAEAGVGSRIEIVVDGQVAGSTSGPVLDETLDLSDARWVLARCYQDTPGTVRLAHTGPVYVTGARRPRDDGADRAYFAHWVDELIAATRAEPQRFTSAARRDEALELYDRAARFYRPV